MPMIKTSKVYTALHIALIVTALLLSIFNGMGSILWLLVFSGNESMRMWVSIHVPATLWIPNIICFWFPKSGFAAYAVILAASVILCVDPILGSAFVNWYRCSDYLRFAILGCALLFVNIFVPGRALGKSWQETWQEIRSFFTSAAVLEQRRRDADDSKY